MIKNYEFERVNDVCFELVSKTKNSTVNNSGYLVIETELDFKELSSSIKRVKTDKLDVTGVTWSLSLLLAGTEVSVHKQKDVYYIPFSLNESSDCSIEFNKENVELEQKIMNTKIRMFCQKCTDDLLLWYPKDLKSEIVSSEIMFNELNQSKVAQIGLYAVGINAWIQSAELFDGDVLVGMLHDAFCGTTLDKKQFGLPVPKQGILTFSFCNYLKTNTGGYTFKHAPCVKLVFDEQFLPDTMPKVSCIAIIKD